MLDKVTVVRTSISQESGLGGGTCKGPRSVFIASLPDEASPGSASVAAADVKANDPARHAFAVLPFVHELSLTEGEMCTTQCSQLQQTLARL